MKTLGIIPARYQSSRFPGKPLAPILGKPLILWVCERSALAFGRERLVVATDDRRIAEVVESAGYLAAMTSDGHPTGTDRLAEVAEAFDADIYVNVQGDEPLVRVDDIRQVISEKQARPAFVVNAYARMSLDEDPNDANIPKVLVNERGDLLYASRLPIPGVKRSAAGRPDYLKQVCIYAFSGEELRAFHRCRHKGSSEHFEDIEILRFLEIGIPVRMVEVSGSYQAVDVPHDVLKVERLLEEQLSV